MQYILTQEEYDQLTGAGVEDSYKEKYEDLTRELEAFVNASHIDIYKDHSLMGNEIVRLQIPADKLNGKLLGAFRIRIAQLKH